MSILVMACAVAMAILLSGAAEAIPAFPGAEGYGKYAKGGRGGEVIYVTTLEDSGPGSLRSALEVSGPRNILFKIGGMITLESPIVVSNPYLTIAGQTAPGDGIMVTTNGFGAHESGINTISIRSHDVIVRHIRVRPAATRVHQFRREARHPDADAWMDAIGLVGSEAHEIILDHVSTSWGSKDEIQVWGGGHDITVQYSVMSEGLKINGHKGALAGGGSDRVTFYECLFAHCGGRNPYVKARDDDRDHIARFQVVDNVIYNWGRYGSEIGGDDDLYWSPLPGMTHANLIGNFYKPGPSTDPNVYEILACLKHRVRIYLEDNVGPHRPDSARSDWDLVGLRWFGPNDEAPHGTPAPEAIFREQCLFDSPALPTLSAGEAYEEVLRNVGATLPRRDAVDERVINDVRGSTGRIIDNPAEVGGWPDLPVVSRPDDYDTDGDGMPDSWEMARFGTLARDGRDDANEDGYTDLEDFLNEGILDGGQR